MRRAAYAVLALWLVLTAREVRGEQSVSTQPGSTFRPTSYVPVNAFLSIPFASSGNVTTDANTVAHVTFDGTQLADSAGNAWTRVGAPTQNVASPLYPQGFDGAATRGAGPFSNTSYYYLGSGSDPLDFTGSFTMCFVFYATSLPGVAQALLTNMGDDAGLRSGYQVIISGAGQLLFGRFTSAGAVAYATSAAAIGIDVNAGCVGRAGTTFYAKLNTGAAGTLADGGAYRVPTTEPASIGTQLFDGVPGTPATAIVLYDVHATTTAWDATAVASAIARATGQVTSTGAPLTVTRSSIATHEAPAGMFTYGAGMLRVGSDGAHTEAASSNYIFNSDDVTVAGGYSTYGTITLTANACTGPLGATMERGQITGVGTSGVGRTVTIPSGTTRTLSAYLRAYTGTQPYFVQTGCGSVNVATCTCTRSDGAVCTPEIVPGFPYLCRHVGTVGTTPVRVAVAVTCAAASTTANADVGALADSDLCFGALQVEASLVATSYIATTTTSAARQADIVSAAFTPTTQTSLCTKWTMKPAPSNVSNQEYPLGFGNSWSTSSTHVMRSNTLSWAVTVRGAVAAQGAIASLQDGASHAMEWQHIDLTSVSGLDQRLKVDGVEYLNILNYSGSVNTISPLFIGGAINSTGQMAWLHTKNVRVFATTCDKVTSK
jgi:hypothetical protein